MDKVYIVMSGTEVDSAYKLDGSANNRVAELCMFGFEDVLYDENGFAYSESHNYRVVPCEVI